MTLKWGEGVHRGFEFFAFHNFSPSPLPGRSCIFFRLFLDDFGNFTLVQGEHIGSLNCNVENNINRGHGTLSVMFTTDDANQFSADITPAYSSQKILSECF